MKICPYCGAEYPDDVSRCPIDNSPVVELPVSPAPRKIRWAIRRTIKALTFERISRILTALLVATFVAVPVSLWIRHRKAAAAAASAASNCINNLFYIDYAKKVWARDYQKDSNAIPTWDDVAPNLSIGWDHDAKFKPPTFPSGGTYTLGRVGELPTCSCPNHSMLLVQLTVHVGDADLDEGEGGGADERYYDPAEKKFERRPAGSIVGATVMILDETGHYIKKKTNLGGTAIVNSWPNKPVAVIVSKRGFLSVSNPVSTNAPLAWGAMRIVLQKPGTPREENISQQQSTSQYATVFAQANTNTNAPHFGWPPGYRPGVAPTAAYRTEMERVMVEEANRFARQMNLPEELPITIGNARASVWPPSWYIRRGEIGSVTTKNFIYRVDVGKGVAGFEWPSLIAEWDQWAAKYTWPISRLDTNFAFQEAEHLLRKADVDVDALNRDAGSVSIDASMTEGTNGSHFLPVYWIAWRKAVTNDDAVENDNSDDNLGRLLVSVNFLQPTRAIGQLYIYDPKYIHRKALETLDLFPLLTTDPVHNPPDAVRREIESGTNAAVLRQILLEQHTPKYLLRKWGLEPTNPPAGTKAATATH